MDRRLKNPEVIAEKELRPWYSFPCMRKDTIAAIATPPGTGAISVIRVSGETALEIAEAVFSRSTKHFKTHTAHYGNILTKDHIPIDNVLLLIMRSPRSYTGEDSIEISCHGGLLVTRRVLERVLEAGARPAQPGEFSLRAYLNGKLDLAQAEAIQELITAKNTLALENAEKQLEGALSKTIRGFQKQLIDIAAILEAWVDFPEEGLEFASKEELVKRLESVLFSMAHLRDTFHDGKSLHTGLSLCLLGAPNVGKSSLMNALLGKDRAIVTEIAGTTRDVLEEDLHLGSFHFKLMDTAGIRDTQETIEKEGIRRSEKAMQEADLILLILDTTRAPEQELIQRAPPEKTVIVWNKIDLAQPQIDIPSVKISAKEKIGLDLLKKAIEQKIWKHGIPAKDEILITQQRHFHALSSAVASCQAVLHGLQSEGSPEFVTSDMRACLNELGTIIGTNVTEDILSAIFSKFCLGK